jgi:hypothetical protein
MNFFQHIYNQHSAHPITDLSFVESQSNDHANENGTLTSLVQFIMTLISLSVSLALRLPSFFVWSGVFLISIITIEFASGNSWGVSAKIPGMFSGFAAKVVTDTIEGINNNKE